MQSTLTRLANNITVIDAHYVQRGIASIYIVTQNKKVTLIETGTAHSVPYILGALTELGFTPNDVEYVIPTHIHLDHAGGAGELLDRCPQATLVIHPRGAAHMIDPAKLEAGTMAVYGEEKYRKLYGTLKPIKAQRVMVADDGFELDFNGRILRFIDT
ncbi:MAG: MBL fold metallo-hydrolase, partial [Cocleimonas sp.]|nr:MBL fold metallo-hydrolase [Cocleimonas sp.]